MSRQAPPFKAYQGDEPYIFVSYAHEDSHLVYPEIEWLHHQGLNIWFDEGISPGSVWSDALGRAIENAACLLLFVTERSVGSQHCVDETNLALDAGKAAVAVHLTRTELTPGLRLRLNAHQAILKYELSDLDYKAKLLIGLGSDPATAEQSVPGATPAIAARPALVVVGLVAVAVVAATLMLQLPTDEAPSATTGGGARVDLLPATSREGPSIAVLPFENLSPLEENAFLAAGIHDHTLSTLAKIRGLKVISRTSVLPYADSGKSTTTIGEELKVNHILEGSVQRAGDTLRITVQLIDASVDSHLWAETYDREFSATNVFAIQSDVASNIAASLEAELSAEDADRLAMVETTDSEAYQFYLRGRQGLRESSCRAFDDAALSFQRATELDPDYAAAFAGLALAQPGRREFCGVTRDEWRPKMQTATDRALELAPSLGEGHVARAFLLWTPAPGAAPDPSATHLKRVEAAFKLALELAPDFEQAYTWYGVFLRSEMRFEEALAVQRRNLEVNPRSYFTHIAASQFLHGLGRIDEALAELDAAQDIEPANHITFAQRASVFAYALGQYDKAIGQVDKALELEPSSATGASQMAILHLLLGDDKQAEAWIKHSRSAAPEAFLGMQIAFTMHWLRGEDGPARQVANEMAELDPLTAAFWRAQLDARAGRIDDAIAAVEKANPEITLDTPDRGMLRTSWPELYAHLLVDKGEGDKAKRLLELSLQSIGGTANEWFDILQKRVVATTLQGDVDQAIALLRDSVDEGWGIRLQRRIEAHFALAPLRRHRHYPALHERMKAVQAAQLRLVRSLGVKGPDA